MNDKSNINESRRTRRQFLANLLFAGGALTLSGQQGAQAAEHPTDGWKLPDLGQSDPRPSPTPPPPPQPLPPGKPAPPVVMGRFVTPRGDVTPTCPPPKPGEVKAPRSGEKPAPKKKG